MGHAISWRAAVLFLAIDLSAGAVVAEPAGRAGARELQLDGSVIIAQRLLEAGIDAYNWGQFDTTVDAISEALRSGLPSHQIARAYFYRGLAMRRLGKPGLAVTDLTSALNHKIGLPEAARSEAIENRIAARREAGLTDEDAVVTNNGRRDKSAPPARRRAPETEPAVISTGSIGSLETAMQLSRWSGATEVAASPAPPAAAPATPGPAAAVAAPPSAAPAVSAPAPAARAAPVAVAAPAGNVPWTVSSVIPTAPPGKVYVQVAEARSRNEAIGFAVRLTSQRGVEFGRKLKISESLAEANGPVYRLWLGPYASDGEHEQLCNALRESGYDCIIR